MDSDNEEQLNPAPATSRNPRISDIIPFQDVARTLEKVYSEPKADKKKKYLEKLFASYRESLVKKFGSLDSDKCGGDSLYPLIRMLLPREDRGRGAYRLKSQSLSKMMVQVIGLGENSPEAIRLNHYRDPKRAGSAAGNISTVIFEIVKSRLASNEDDSSAKPSLSDIHDALDRLARGRGAAEVNQEDQKKILRSLYKKLTALEVKWLIRLLLKDLFLGVSKSVIFGLLHKQALSISKRISSLEVLCQKLNDPSVDASTIDISLLHHFLPMLATRVDIIESAFETNGPTPAKSKDAVTLPAPPFIVETKWDGERFQIHYNGLQFTYLSRRGHDYSKNFNETLTPRLRPQISPSVQSFILDGEMMAYSKKHKIFTQKGFDIDVKTMNKDNPNHMPVFVAFDLIYLNGDTLTKLPLKERRRKLGYMFRTKDDVVRISEAKMMNSKQEVVDCLNIAIGDGEEGLIVKDINSSYVPGERDLKWLKIKPEYLEGNSVDDLDLLILGAYYTDSSRRGGDINHFLVGIADKPVGKPVEYHPLTTVGSGRLRSVALKELVQMLAPKFVSPTTSESVWKSVHSRQRKKPDFIINPAESVVVQVKASEIIPSDVYSLSLGYTLRFPRVVKIREDKSPTEIMTIQEFHRLREACNGKLAKRTDDGRGAKGSHPFFNRNRKKRHESEPDSDSDGPSPTKRSHFDDSDLSDDDGSDMEDEVPGSSSATQQKGALFSRNSEKPDESASSSSTATSASTTPSTSPQKGHSTLNNLFHSKVFFVCGYSSWKSMIEAKIKKHGGSITQNENVPDLFCIIGQRKLSNRVRKAVESEKYDVMSDEWLLKCIEQKEEIPLEFKHFWGMKKDTKERLKNANESYSESYSQETLVDENEEDNQHGMTTPTRARSLSPDDCGQSSSGTKCSGTPVKLSAPSSTKGTPPIKNAGHMLFDDDSSSSDTDYDDVKNPKPICPAPTHHKPATPDRKDKAASESDSDATDFSEEEPETRAPIRDKRSSKQNKDDGIFVNSGDEDMVSDDDDDDQDAFPRSTFMDEFSIFFRGIINPIIKRRFKRSGGRVCTSEDDAKITHVVVCNEGNPSKEGHLRAIVVTQKWLEDSLHKREALDNEWAYPVN